MRKTNTALSQLRGYKYYPVALFLLLYAVFYFGNIMFTGLTVPHGYYSRFLDEHLNYVKLFRNFLLEGAAFVIRLAGHETRIYDHGIKMEQGGVKLIYACMGFAILSFWWAMILAFPQTLKNKIIYLLGGTAIIVGLNILRIGAVALVFNSDWGRAHRSVDHHLIFNIICYGVLFYMLYRWFNIPSKEPVETQ